jgi:S1-C subfamily serine protease
MKKYLALTLVLVSLLALGDSFHRRHAARYTRAQSSTVLIESSRSFGSGVVTQKENPDSQTRLFIWTAAHVVMDNDDVKVSQVVRLNSRKVGSVNFTAHVIARDSSLDIALLWLDSPPKFFSSSAFDGAAILPVGTQLFHCGNFAGVKLEGSISTGVQSQSGPEAGDFPWQIVDQTTTLVQHGSSGGGIFSDRSGNLVGIAVGLIDNGISLYVPARAVNTFAVVHCVEWAFTGDKCPSDGSLLKLQQAAKVTVKPTANTFLQLLLAP